MAQSYIECEHVLKAHHDELVIFDQWIKRTDNPPQMSPRASFTYKDGPEWAVLDSDDVQSTLKSIELTLQEDQRLGLLEHVQFVSVSAKEATHLWAKGVLTFEHMKGFKRMQNGALAFEGISLTLWDDTLMSVILLVEKRSRGVRTLTGSMTLVGAQPKSALEKKIDKIPNPKFEPLGLSKPMMDIPEQTPAFITREFQDMWSNRFSGHFLIEVTWAQVSKLTASMRQNRAELTRLEIVTEGDTVHLKVTKEEAARVAKHL